MTVSLIQMDIDYGNVDANIAKAEKMMADTRWGSSGGSGNGGSGGCVNCGSGSGGWADLYVLPEMWATGYSVHPEDIAEDEQDSRALAWMKKTSAERQCAVCGSLAIRDGDGLYRNRLYFVTPEGTVSYDKHHLFTYAHEDANYANGDRHTIVDYRGFRLLLLVCYDLRFPVWSRWGRAGEYDAIVYVANWPSARQFAWDTLLRARAIENQCYVVAVNRVGRERKIQYGGGSAVIDPQGITKNACQGHECTCQAEIDTSTVEIIRNDFPVLLDRD